MMADKNPFVICPSSIRETLHVDLSIETFDIRSLNAMIFYVFDLLPICIRLNHCLHFWDAHLIVVNNVNFGSLVWQSEFKFSGLCWQLVILFEKVYIKRVDMSVISVYVAELKWCSLGICFLKYDRNPVSNPIPNLEKKRCFIDELVMINEQIV